MNIRYLALAILLSVGLLAAACDSGDEATPVTSDTPVIEDKSTAELTWWGQAMFTLVATDGTRVVFDPYSDIGYQLPTAEELAADVVTVSHDHPDHSSGGEVFADTAIVVAHENAKRAISGEERPTAVPDITFNDRMTIELGGKRVELIYPGLSHSDNLIVMYFPEERAVFTVDMITVKRLGYMTLSDAHFPDWMDAIRRVEAIDFDILVPGHGALGTKQDAADHGQYVKDLKTEVEAAVAAGKSLDEMKASIKLEKYASWGQYKEWQAENIEGMHRMLTQ